MATLSKRLMLTIVGVFVLSSGGYGRVVEAGPGEIYVPGLAHYCSMAAQKGGWYLAWGGANPCEWINSKHGPFVTIKRAGVYSAKGVNNVVVRCDGGYVGIYAGVGAGPLKAAYDAARKPWKKGCFFTAAPKSMPIFASPYNLKTKSVKHQNAFDFARNPYKTLNVQNFGQPGSKFAKIVDYKGRQKKQIDNHDSHDWNMPRYTPMYAVAKGRVRKARHFLTNCTGSDGPVQGEVYIEHTVARKPSTYSERIISSYFHLAKLEVVDGQWVKQGDLIGQSGHTGCSSTPHLHFAVMRLTNTANNWRYKLTINKSGNNGWRTVIEPYGFSPPKGFDPWAWRAYPNGALSIQLWKAGHTPPY